MHNDLEKILFTEQEIANRVKEMADVINKDFENRPITLVVILKGSAIFAADLVRHLTSDIDIEFIRLSSYGNGSVSSQKVDIIGGLNFDVNGKNIIVVEDIIDTGTTLSKFKEIILSQNPESLKICSLLNKPARRVSVIEADYKGFDIENEFVVGYGLDYAQKYRNLPYIGVLKRSVYEK